MNILSACVYTCVQPLELLHVQMKHVGIFVTVCAAIAADRCMVLPLAHECGTAYIIAAALLIHCIEHGG